MDFKSLRVDKLGLSVEEMSKMAGASPDEIRKWDESISAPSIKNIQNIAEKTGLDYNAILSYEKPKIEQFQAEDAWEKIDFTKKSLVGYLESALDNYNLTDEYKRKYIDDLTTSVKNTLVKPSIAIVGRSDTGKSTLINALLGQNKMPTSWTPTTSIAVYIKHISDRPEFIKDDVWVFADHNASENLWDVKKLCDKEYCNKWKIAQGSVEILREFGTRQGESFSKQAGAAVIFVDSPILKNCDIVDLPGFGTETESDDLITMKAAQRTDILIYLSQANGFMRIEDITYLKENIRNLPVWEERGKNKLEPLSNLFIVASQAHTVNNGNRRDLLDILSKGCENFSKTLGADYWYDRIYKSGYNVDFSKTILPKRFFTYTTDIPDLCNNFNRELKAITEAIPKIIEEKAKTIVKNYVKSRKPDLDAEIKHYENIILERDKYMDLLKQIDDNELERNKETIDSRNKILDSIDLFLSESKNEFTKYYSEKINTDAIASLIKQKGLKNKKDDIQLFSSQLQDSLSETCASILKDKSDKLSDETKKYVSKFNEGIGSAFKKSNVDVDFDAGFAFVSALAKLGIVGGLGAYLAGEAAFYLGSAAFVAGLGGDIAIGSAFFGPIGVVVGLAIAAVIGIVKLFGGGWEKNVAKKLVKAFDDNNVIEKYLEEVDRYWNNTKDAFDKAAKKLDEEWDKYVNTLRSTVSDYDIEKINRNILVLKNIESFFKNIPL